MKNCIELDAVDKWIDLRLLRMGQSYLSLRGQDDEETSFFCLAPISMTIESKDFFCNANLGCVDSLEFTLLWRGGIRLSLRRALSGCGGRCIMKVRF